MKLTHVTTMLVAGAAAVAIAAAPVAAAEPAAAQMTPFTAAASHIVPIGHGGGGGFHGGDRGFHGGFYGDRGGWGRPWGDRR
jgi:Spy/CpxP family protein refolding chaperone